MSDLFVSEGLIIPEAELEERFIRASGPGGQNVNKVASAVKLRFDVRRSASLPGPVRERLLSLHDARLDGRGVLTITARRFREQARNRADARARLAGLILASAQPKRVRRPTRPSLASKRLRTQAKKQRARVKKNRTRPALD
ncbi:MAG: alternative ribosome rescue aminoacyl-tRNA hydrolase ArfB [Rhizomicrobium sp.]